MSHSLRRYELLCFHEHKPLLNEYHENVVQLSEAHRLRSRVAEYLQHRFGIGHIVLQLEC